MRLFKVTVSRCRVRIAHIMDQPKADSMVRRPLDSTVDHMGDRMVDNTAGLRADSTEHTTKEGNEIG
jgi:hypothetical protein